jgi:hypothetical protein
MYHIKTGAIEHSRSPGGHYILLNDNQKDQLLEKMKAHTGNNVENINGSLGGG